MEWDLREVMGIYLILNSPLPSFPEHYFSNETYVQHFSKREKNFGHFKKFLQFCELYFWQISPPPPIGFKKSLKSSFSRFQFKAMFQKS